MDMALFENGGLILLFDISLFHLHGLQNQILENDAQTFMVLYLHLEMQTQKM
jgi:hypothetical protein